MFETQLCCGGDTRIHLCCGIRDVRARHPTALKPASNPNLVSEKLIFFFSFLLFLSLEKAALVTYYKSVLPPLGTDIAPEPRAASEASCNRSAAVTTHVLSPS